MSPPEGETEIALLNLSVTDSAFVLVLDLKVPGYGYSSKIFWSAFFISDHKPIVKC